MPKKVIMVFVEQENKIQDQLTFFIPGAAATYLPEGVIQASALKVSQALIEHPNTMLQFTPEQLVDSINKGWAVLALGEKLEPVGFAQLWQYGFNEGGQQVLEFGSWLSLRKGCGEKLLYEAVCLGRKINPTAQIIAIIERENSPAQTILQKTGAEEIGNKFSPVIRTVEGEAALMKVFDITRILSEKSEKEMKILQKNREFERTSQEMSSLDAQRRMVPDSLFQYHNILRYWLSVNLPGWKPNGHVTEEI